MNMQKIILEALSASDEKRVALASGRNLAKLISYTFPVDANKVHSYEIVNRINNGKPVDFEWAADNFKDDGSFLYDLGNSLAPQLKKNTSLFFNIQGPRANLPLVSKMKEGPVVFDYFGKMMAPTLVERADNTLRTTFDSKGNANTTKMDNEKGFITVEGPYYRNLEKELKYGKELIEKDSNLYTEKSTNTEFEDSVLCGAYLRYMFNVFNDAKKQIDEATGDKAKKARFDEMFRDTHTLSDAYSALETLTQMLDIKSGRVKNADYTPEDIPESVDELRDKIAEVKNNIPMLEEYAGHVSNVIARGAINAIPMDETGTLSNWGSILNQGDNGESLTYKVIDPTRITEGTLSEIKMYPRYAIDVLRVKPEITPKLVSVLKNTGYEDIAQQIKNLGGPDDNRILPITIDRMKELLTDANFVTMCMKDEKLSSIFEKGGTSWVGATDADSLRTSLDKLLAGKPQRNNAEIRNPRVVPVVVGKSLKSSNTSRERTGDGVVAQTYVDMDIADATAVKLSDGDTKINYTTKGDGKHRTVTLSPGWDGSRTQKVFPNVISRKSTEAGGGHEHFITIPFGIAFVTMQDEDGNIVRTETPDTLCMGLRRNGNDYNCTSIQNLMNSPIGKYCKAVEKLGKVGRVRFTSAEANTAYTRILGALKRFKIHDQDFSCNPVSSMKDNLAQLDAVITFALNHGPERNKPSDSEIAANIQSIKAPLLARGVSMQVEVYNPEIGRFEFKHANRMSFTMMSHLRDMYNLDNTDGYSKEAVLNVLSAVAPNVWDLSKWNYANVLRAEKALNTQSEENASVVDNADGMEDSDDAEYKDAVEVFDDNMNYHTANDGSSEEPTLAEYDVPSKDIGRDVTDALESAVNEAYVEAFGHSKTEPSTERDATRYQTALVQKFDEMTRNNELNLPGISQAVAAIKFENFKDFNEKLFRIVRGMVANSPSYDDDSLRMGFFAESGKSTSWMVNVVKNVVADHLPEKTSEEDAELITEVSGLMAKFAFVNSVETGDMEHVFDRDYLTSTFETVFNREVKESGERLELLNQRINGASESLDESKKTDLVNASDADFKQAQLYQTVQEKMVSDPQFIAGVADLIVRNSGDIKNILIGKNNLTDTISKGYVSFRPDTASTFDAPGMGIIDFCMYNMEANKEKQNVNKLIRSFGNPVVASMMDDLVSSVPSDSLSTDSIRAEKSIEDVDDNQRSLLMSYFKKANRYNANFTNRIKALYTGASVEDQFAIEESMGDTSPYTYNGVEIDLRKVKPFFDTLMEFADSYNKIGTSASNQDGITHIQETVNNEELDKHVLHNNYFSSLHSDFIAVYNRFSDNQPFTASDKRVMDRVVRDVLTNPMNVLINNNVKLVTAYVYLTGLIDKNLNAQYQSNQSQGFGSGEKVDPTIRGNNLAPSLRGVNRNYDMKTAALDLSYRITHSMTFVEETLPKAESVVGNLDTAFADYQSYLDSINGDGDHVRGLVDQVLSARPSGVKKPSAEDIDKAQTKKRDDVLNNMSVFCNYGIDDNTKAADAQRITDLRINELIVLLYRTAYEIWKDIPQPTPDRIKGIVNANRDLLYSKILNRKNAIIPQELFERFRNLDAELQLADPAKHSSIYGHNNSNNDTAASAGDIMQERSRYSENRTGEIVDKFISEEPLDESSLKELFTSTFAKLSDAGVSMSGKCNVVDKKDNGTHISSNIKLHPNDILVFKEKSVTRPASVIDGIGNPDDKQYLITNVPGIDDNDTDIEFVRFKLQNKFIGGPIQAKADDVFAQLNEWCDEYTAESVPDEVMFKALCLKYIFAGSGCAKVIKTLVSYYVWKLSGYDDELTPKGDISGDTPTGHYIGEFRRVIANDLRTFSKTDPRIYNMIYDFATNTGIMDSIRANTNLSSNEDTKRETKENEELIYLTADDTNVKDMFKHLANYIVEKYGFVSQFLIDNTLPKVMSSKKGADEIIDLAHDSYKEVVKSIIRNANMVIATPLVNDYKRECASSGVSPTVDGAIQYVKDNYAGPKTTDDNGNNINDELAEYLKENCSAEIEWLLRKK